MPGHNKSNLQDPKEDELNIELALADIVQDLKRRILHLETLESGGGLNALDKVELIVDTASIAFTNISGEFAALKVIASVRIDRAAIVDTVAITFNNDTGNNYDDLTNDISFNATLSTGEEIAVARIRSSAIVADNAPASVFSILEFDIVDYAGGNHKSVLGRSEQRRINSTGNLIFSGFVGWWRSTDAIIKIDIAPVIGAGFLSGSKFYLYGITK